MRGSGVHFEAVSSGRGIWIAAARKSVGITGSPDESCVTAGSISMQKVAINCTASRMCHASLN